MDVNISAQVKRLIELDRKAIELQEVRERELLKLGNDYLEDKDKINLELQEARQKSKLTYDDMVQQAKKDVEAMTDDANKRIKEIEEKMTQEVETIALEWWKKISEGLK